MTGTMIIDDVEGFLRFLDNASFQLACLLDLDGQRSTNKKSLNRQKSSISSASTKTTRISRPRALNSSNQTTTTAKRQQQIKLLPPTRAKGRRKGSANNTVTDTIASELDQCQQQQQQQQQHLNELNGSLGQQQHHQLDNHSQQRQQQHHNQHSHHQHHQALTTSNAADYELNPSHQQNHQHQNHHQQHHLHNQQEQQHHHHHHQQQTDQLAALQSKLQHLTGNSETHTLDGQLTLGITDELPLDHGSSISPGTHLSPMDSSSIQFNPIHQQHYYPNQRGSHLDSYHIHDEFTSHDQIPTTNASSSSHIGPEPVARQVGHQHQLTILSSHQQQQSSASLRAGNIDSSTLSSPANCYSAQHSHHMHQQQPQHHQQQHHQQQQRNQHHHHQTHYHQLDQQWLGSSTHTADSNLNQLSAPDSSALDYVAPLSPVTHQSLDQVQFNTPLYHHSYYNSQSEQLDSFQHISDDYTTNSSPLTGVSSSSPIGHIHRMQQDPQQQQQQHHHHHHHHHHQQQQQQTQQQPQAPHHQQQQLRMPSLDVNNASSNTSNSYDQHSHHSHHAQLESHQLQTMNTTYNGHNHHHQHNQLMPLMNGLESNGVILQDINLASASWSSPEDLYGI